MSAVEYIICQTNHLNELKDRLGSRLHRLPISFFEYLTEYLRLGGIGGLPHAFFGNAGGIDVAPYVERNLRRREIRLTSIYGNPVTKALYRMLLGVRARISARLIAARLDQYPQATAVIFNGFLMPGSLLSAVAIARGRNRLYIEKGFFPNTVQCDRQGINAASTLSRDPAFYRWVASKIGLARPDLLVKRVSKRQGDTLLTALPQRYVFVPFQVPSDMQILAHSPFVRDMEHLYDVVFQAAEALPDLTFVLKEHPSFALSIKDKVPAHPRVLFANRNDTRELIEKSHCLLTINSTVGLEGLTLNRKVVTLGDAPYNVEGLVLTARSIPEVIERLVKIDEFTPDEHLRDAFIGYVFNEFLLPGDLMKPDDRLEDEIKARAAARDRHSLLLAEFAAAQGRAEGGTDV